MKEVISALVLVSLLLVGCGTDTDPSISSFTDRDTSCQNSDQCPADMQCTDNRCQTVICEYCQYVENHVCVSYDCCTNEDCMIWQSCVDHECIAPELNESEEELIIFQEEPETEFIEKPAIDETLDFDYRDCGTSITCLANSASSCTPARAFLPVEMYEDGVTEISESEVRIEPQGDYCRYYEEVQMVDAYITADMRKSMLANGFTEKEIDDIELQGQLKVLNYVGAIRDCLFSDQELNTMFERWADGEAERADFDVAIC